MEATDLFLPAATTFRVTIMMNDTHPEDDVGPSPPPPEEQQEEEDNDKEDNEDDDDDDNEE